MAADLAQRVAVGALLLLFHRDDVSVCCNESVDHTIQLCLPFRGDATPVDSSLLTVRFNQVVFWTVLASGALDSSFSAWSNISEHALNTFFALSELLIPRTRPSPWINLPVVIVLLALYLALAELTYATQGWYVYLFLDP